MPHPAKSQYLEGKVFTASQPQLQVMLLDGAIRFGRIAQKMWGEGTEFSELNVMLDRMAEVVDALTHGVAQGKTEFSSQLEEQYAFIYRELAACRINEEVEKLDSCLKLLEYQRETWKQACEVIEKEAVTTKLRLPHMAAQATRVSEGFSLEA